MVAVGEMARGFGGLVHAVDSAAVAYSQLTGLKCTSAPHTLSEIEREHEREREGKRKSTSVSACALFRVQFDCPASDYLLFLIPPPIGTLPAPLIVCVMYQFCFDFVLLVF